MISFAGALYVDKTIAAGGDSNGAGLVVIVVDAYRTAFEFLDGLAIARLWFYCRNRMAISQ